MWFPEKPSQRGIWILIEMTSKGVTSLGNWRGIPLRLLELSRPGVCVLHTPQRKANSEVFCKIVRINPRTHPITGVSIFSLNSTSYSVFHLVIIITGNMGELAGQNRNINICMKALGTLGAICPIPAYLSVISRTTRTYKHN